ncbi:MULTISPECIES: phage tail assembly chaperone [unclassified Roseitalea]|uniref:phage tail assembly chaperone n=1 Tax=unclassified Roseitalea TaxID=2639107 RepID=UPI002740253D|nr:MULTISPECIES: phage tail assembly chaperone [unclassified Roseitalea]
MSAERAPFPWAMTMRFGLGVLGLSPADFWAMTPREIAAAMRAHERRIVTPPDPASFAALRAAFPDAAPTQGANGHD